MSSAFIDVSAHNLLNSGNAINEEEEEKDQQQYLGQDLASDLRNCSISSAGSIDIDGQPVSSDILVALLDRPGEMRGLAACNAQFYEALEHYITETQGNDAWQRFQDVVYKPRDKLPDRSWMNQISQFLAHNPVFLTKFKESVGYQDDEVSVSTPDYTTSTSPTSFVPPRKLTSSQSTGSINTIGSNHNGGSGGGRRRSRRLSSMSLGDAPDYNDRDSISFEDAPKVTEGMFATEDQFYHQYQQQNVPAGGFGGGRRRRSSYHSIQSEPHPTFVESKIDEVDEANIEVEAQESDQESDHLADLLDSESDDEQEDQDTTYLRNTSDRIKDIGAGSSTPTGRGRSSRNYCDMDLIKLREDPDFQARLPQTHASYFRKAKHLLSIAPSSRRFSATVRRNSILEDAMPPSPVTELDEPRFQTCSEMDEEDTDGNNLARLICTTRRQQPDDIAWLNSVMEALAGWPELVDRLHDIVQESLEDNNSK
ncbi:hypothetical protein V8B55DRAFT_1552891 [Mucor lusitanicus]|uniref:Uncharacterized protein n=2 Tax=Mucor circinelloides f. lusitanicus TaxID=29924 RepID=A0A168P685_MUCCL|nr:hypothetical protein FB192DRAFT_1398479 [Mucor lusitanicus]OAD07231.1 hypothetical protein MUCCIDRAFT_77781 [Mucor lusitanicus CBS 277.49]